MEAPPLSRFSAAREEPAPPPLRIGVLGAARITPMALVRPAREVPEVRLEAVAARDPRRAQAFARKHGFARTVDHYAALVEDPELDAIYNPLPNSLHCDWTIRALEAGKHVLCEKPLASNAREAERMVDAAEKSGRVLMEAFHWRYHPLADRMLELINGGALGTIRHIETRICVPLLLPRDIRYRFDLAGGALMDTGCYAIHMLRTLGGDEPEVLRAESRLSSPQVDRWTRADFRFADGRTGRIECSLMSTTLLSLSIRVKGDRGEMRVFNPMAPQYYHRLQIRTPDGRTSERVNGRSTYVHQLRAFADAVAGERSLPTGGADAIANMETIDAVYLAAGLMRRGE